MSMMSQILVIGLLLAASQSLVDALPISAAETKVVHLTLLFRHGNRAPLYFMPTDPVNRTYWDRYGGAGELTTKGHRVEYDLGVALRKQYGFLNRTYSSRRVRVRSTDVDRTLLSAQLVMAGLFKPSAMQSWNKNLPWIPIPIHTEPYATDSIYPSSPSSCPPFQALIVESLTSKENLDFINAHMEYYQNAREFAGFNETGDDPNLMMIRIVDTLICEKAEGLALPKWAKENYAKYLEIFNYAFQRDLRTPKMSKFFAGAQLNEIRNNLIKKANGSLSYELSVYSTHDTMLAALVQLLDMSLPRIQPPFGSAFMFELRQDATGNHYVRVMAKINMFDEPTRFQEVTIADCGVALCPLEKFVEATADKILLNYKAECQKQPVVA